jgi:hypothetical protein
MSRGSISFLCTLALCSLTACDDLAAFKTDTNSVFRGEVVGSDSDVAQSSFIRQGFPSRTQLELTFDPSVATLTVPSDGGPAPSSDGPGTIDTYLCPAGKAHCAVELRTPGPITHARLLPIESLAHDALSQYTFPGGGRIRNYIFGLRFDQATPTGAISRYAMIFLSLMDSGRVEVRAMAPSVLASGAPTEIAPALFGLFVLERHKP